MALSLTSGQTKAGSPMNFLLFVPCWFHYQLKSRADCWVCVCSPVPHLGIGHIVLTDHESRRVTVSKLYSLFFPPSKCYRYKFMYLMFQKERPIFSTLECGVRKGLPIEKAQLRKMGIPSGFCKSVLRDPRIYESFIVKGRAAETGRRWVWTSDSWASEGIQGRARDS